jgi:hypothetical protein
MWTVQEVILPGMNKIFILCGTTMADWSLCSLALKGFEIYSGRNAYWSRWTHAIGLQMYLQELVVSRAVRGREVSPGPIAQQIFRRTRPKACQDPKDKIFALFSVLKELGIQLPPPDYENSVERIYIEATTACINHDKNLSSLLEAPSNERNLNLPSWVPDWNVAWYDDLDPRSADIIGMRFEGLGIEAQ